MVCHSDWDVSKEGAAQPGAAPTDQVVVLCGKKTTMNNVVKLVLGGCVPTPCPPVSAAAARSNSQLGSFLTFSVLHPRRQGPGGHRPSGGLSRGSLWWWCSFSSPHPGELTCVRHRPISGVELTLGRLFHCVLADLHRAATVPPAATAVPPAAAAAADRRLS